MSGEGGQSWEGLAIPIFSLSYEGVWPVVAAARAGQTASLRLVSLEREDKGVSRPFLFWRPPVASTGGSDTGEGGGAEVAGRGGEEAWKRDCSSDSLWVDADGDGCAAYERNEGWCQEAQGAADEGGAHAGDKCCVCGGGDRDGARGAAAPPKSREIEAVPAILFRPAGLAGFFTTLFETELLTGFYNDFFLFFPPQDLGGSSRRYTSCRQAIT